MTFVVAAFLLGILGSLHCVGMCGPIALAVPIGKNGNRIWSILLYNSGRAFTYALLGLLSGMAGKAIAWSSGQQFLSIAAGVIILMLLLLELASHKFRMPSLLTSTFIKIKAPLSQLLQSKRKDAVFLIGILNGLLPCGLVYAALAGAVSTGSMLNGALFMFVFGLGTIPAMVTLSWVGWKLPVGLKNKFRKAVPVFIAMMALLLVLRGLGLGIPILSPEPDKGRMSCPYCQK